MNRNSSSYSSNFQALISVLITFLSYLSSKYCDRAGSQWQSVQQKVWCVQFWYLPVGDILLWHAISRSQLLRSDICCCSTGRWSVLNAVHGFLQCLNLTHCCKTINCSTAKPLKVFSCSSHNQAFFGQITILSFLFFLKWPSFKYLCPILITSPLRPPSL